MKLKHSILTFAAVAMTMGVLTDAKAQHRSGPPFNASTSLVRQAQTLERLAAQLGDEFRSYYRQSPNARHLTGDAIAIGNRARSIQNLARSHSPSFTHLNREIAGLEKLSHHLRNEVGISHRGRYGASRHNPVQQLLRSIDGSIAGLRTEVASLQRANSRNHGHANPSHGRGHSHGSVPNPGGRGGWFR